MSSSPSSSGDTTQPPPQLIPGLPDDVSSSILASIPISHHSRLKPTSRSWRAFLSSTALLHLRRPRHLLCIFHPDLALFPPYLFDPSTLAWSPLPPVPCSPYFYGLSNFVPVAIGSHLYLLGGSQFDARSYPLGLPVSSPAAYRLDLSLPSPLRAWTFLPDMPLPRGSFACAAVAPALSAAAAGAGVRIVAAGGGSRHTMFPSGGTRTDTVHVFDESTGKWTQEAPLPRPRAGCVGWVMDGEREEEFWVMGGYGDYRTVSGMFPADVYYRNGAVLGLRSGAWRQIGDMWEEGERRKLGPLAVLHGEDGETPGIFMLDQNGIFRYDIDSNRWFKVTTVRRKIVDDESCGFVAMNGELYILTSAQSDPRMTRSPKPLRKRAILDIQAYHPKRRKWRFLTTTTPFNQPIEFKFTTLCTMQL